MCDCINEQNETLRENDSQLVLSKAGDRVMVATEKVPGSPRTKLITLRAKFCPFCGEDYAAA